MQTENVENVVVWNIFFIWRAIFFFSRQVLDLFWVPGSMLSCFSDFLLLCLHCFSAFLLFAFPASLLSAFPASLLFLLLLFLLLCFSASLFSLLLLLCFCTSGPFHFYYSTCSFLQSCVFPAILPAPLLKFASCLYCLFVFHFLLHYSVLFVS